jgi:hypothetical protein
MSGLRCCVYCDRPLTNENSTNVCTVCTEVRDTNFRNAFVYTKILMLNLTDEQRRSIMRDYCIHCGTPNLPCFCLNDE